VQAGYRVVAFHGLSAISRVRSTVPDAEVAITDFSSNPVSEGEQSAPVGC